MHHALMIVVVTISVHHAVAPAFHKQRSHTETSSLQCAATLYACSTHNSYHRCHWLLTRVNKSIRSGALVLRLRCHWLCLLCCSLCCLLCCLLFAGNCWCRQQHHLSIHVCTAGRLWVCTSRVRTKLLTWQATQAVAAVTEWNWRKNNCRNQRLCCAKLACCIWEIQQTFGASSRAQEVVE